MEPHPDLRVPSWWLHPQTAVKRWVFISSHRDVKTLAMEHSIMGQLRFEMLPCSFLVSVICLWINPKMIIILEFLHRLVNKSIWFFSRNQSDSLVAWTKAIQICRKKNIDVWLTDLNLVSVPWLVALGGTLEGGFSLNTWLLSPALDTES